MIELAASSIEKANKYRSSFNEYSTLLKPFTGTNTYDHALECAFEAMHDWSLFYSVNEVKKWFESKRKESVMEVEPIDLNQTEGWMVDPNSGNIRHVGEDFFTVHGLRVKTTSREAIGGWDQPILTQVGYDGGLLGLIRQRIHGVPHYLCEAKFEPGNYGKAQISPSLQATFSNLNKAHKGRKPFFAEYFEQTNEYKGFQILFSAWLAEDGGRLYLKRNKGMLLEIPETFEVALPSNYFIWLSLFQIKQLLKEDAWINPHVRGILSHV